jgi:adenylate cyclase
METPLMVSELLPPAGVDSVLTDQHVADYEGAVDALLAGRWSEALELLHALPAKDRARDFLTIFIAQHNYEPPSGWDGTIPMPSK